MEYTKEFNTVMKFYRNTTPKQKLMFIDLISDKVNDVIYISDTNNLLSDIDTIKPLLK